MIKSYKRECFICFETFRKPVLGKVVTFASLSRYLSYPKVVTFPYPPPPPSEGAVEVIWTLMLRLWVKGCRDEKMRHLHVD